MFYKLFEWSKSSRIDRAIGQLSYLIFVFNWFDILFLNQFFAISADMCGANIMVATILVSIFVAIYIEKPIDDFGHRRFRRLHLAETYSQ